jgi:hypothetical protein
MSPFVSEAQRRFFNINRTRLARQGLNVDEWNKKSEGLKLPERKSKNRVSGAELLKKALSK